MGQSLLLAATALLLQLLPLLILSQTQETSPFDDSDTGLSGSSFRHTKHSRHREVIKEVHVSKTFESGGGSGGGGGDSLEPEERKITAPEPLSRSGAVDDGTEEPKPKPKAEPVSEPERTTTTETTMTTVRHETKTTSAYRPKPAKRRKVYRNKEPTTAPVLERLHTQPLSEPVPLPECPCIRTPHATSECLTLRYDPKYQAATVEEAIDRFIDPSTSDPKIAKRLNPGWVVLDWFQVGAVATNDSQTMEELTYLYRKHKLPFTIRKNTHCRKLESLMRNNERQSGSQAAASPKIVEDLPFLNRVLREIKGDDSVSVCPRRDNGQNEDSSGPYHQRSSSLNSEQSANAQKDVVRRRQQDSRGTDGKPPQRGRNSHNQEGSNDSEPLPRVKISFGSMKIGPNPGRHNNNYNHQRSSLPEASNTPTVSELAPIHYQIHHKRRPIRAAEDYIVRSKREVDCRGKGTPVDEGSPWCGLCHTCWYITTFNDNYFPRFVNHMTCGYDSSCMRGHGQCRDRVRSFTVSRSDYGVWQDSTVNVPSACDCQITMDSKIFNMIK